MSPAGRQNPNKKLVSTAIGRVREVFHKVHLKLYRCPVCCQRRLPGHPRFYPRKAAVSARGDPAATARHAGRKTPSRLNAVDPSRHNPQPPSLGRDESPVTEPVFLPRPPPLSSQVSSRHRFPTGYPELFVPTQRTTGLPRKEIAPCQHDPAARIQRRRVVFWWLVPAVGSMPSPGSWPVMGPRCLWRLAMPALRP